MRVHPTIEENPVVELLVVLLVVSVGVAMVMRMDVAPRDEPVEHAGRRSGDGQDGAAGGASAA